MSSSHLVPCPGCSRHVRAREAACPFCRAALSDVVRASSPPRRVVARFSRAGMIAAGATAVAIAATGCGGTDVATSDDAATSPDVGEMFDASYGGPHYEPEGGYDASADARADTAPPVDAAEDADDVDADDASPPMFDAAYGGPPLDAGSDD